MINKLLLDIGAVLIACSQPERKYLGKMILGATKKHQLCGICPSCSALAVNGRMDTDSLQEVQTKPVLFYDPAQFPNAKPWTFENFKDNPDNKGYDRGIEVCIAARKPQRVPEEDWLPIERRDLETRPRFRLYVPNPEEMKNWTPPKAKVIKDRVNLQRRFLK
ncbi:MAG: hypothetical protein JSU72_20575 [Deltaproteobacteria bacterium]|nr:MAG: hypothetical protein JSU72_20575 [Deltaproteobacteria bacterium]